MSFVNIIPLYSFIKWCPSVFDVHYKKNFLNLVLIHVSLFPFVLVDPYFLHSNWLTGVVHETMHHAFGA